MPARCVSWPTSPARTAERQAAGPLGARPARSEHDRRYLRFNDTFRTVTAQLPAESYAEAKACLEAVAREIPSEDEVSSAGETPSEGQTRWDQRLCDAFKEVIRTRASGTSNGAKAPSPFFVVAHVALGALVEESGQASELAGELEHDGLIDTETVQKLACDATLAVAVDDDVGHTMYEGRARRFPTGAQRREVMRRDRQCRFPGCANVTFADVHHIVPWKLGGRTDLDNLALTVPTSPRCGAPQGLDHDRQRQRGADLLRPERPGHDVAPFAFVDQGHGRSPVGSVGLRRSRLRLKRAGAARPSGR